jgi:hypothetical protein
MFPGRKTGSYLQQHGQWGCRGDPAEENVSCISFVTLVCGCRALGREGSPAAGVEGVGVSLTLGAGWPTGESHPTFVFAGQAGVSYQSHRGSRRAVSFLYFTLQSTPFPWLALEKSRMISTDRQLRPFPWPSCGCVGREWCRLGIVAVLCLLWLKS